VETAEEEVGSGDAGTAGGRALSAMSGEGTGGGEGRWKWRRRRASHQGRTARAGDLEGKQGERRPCAPTGGHAFNDSPIVGWAATTRSTAYATPLPCRLTGPRPSEASILRCANPPPVGCNGAHRARRFGSFCATLSLLAFVLPFT
jgi:hypothetical protein